MNRTVHQRLELDLWMSLPQTDDANLELKLKDGKHFAKRLDGESNDEVYVSQTEAFVLSWLMSTDATVSRRILSKVFVESGRSDDSYRFVVGTLRKKLKQLDLYPVETRASNDRGYHLKRVY